MRKALLASAGAALLLTPMASEARVTRIEIASTAPMATRPGAPDYELVTGMFYGELDPRRAANRIMRTDWLNTARPSGSRARSIRREDRACCTIRCPIAAAG
jgi:hypothetical protein